MEEVGQTDQMSTHHEKIRIDCCVFVCGGGGGGVAVGVGYSREGRGGEVSGGVGVSMNSKFYRG